MSKVKYTGCKLINSIIHTTRVFLFGNNKTNSLQLRLIRRINPKYANKLKDKKRKRREKLKQKQLRKNEQKTPFLSNHVREVQKQPPPQQ